jgi:carboxymethylenebutenolidase
MERKTAADYPQELLDLFHEYQHGDIDRRAFLEGAAKFAIGAVTVAAIYESMTPNFAWAQQVPPDDKRIKVGYEVVPSPAGNGNIKGYLARPMSEPPAVAGGPKSVPPASAGGPKSVPPAVAGGLIKSGKLPVVLVIHENRGLNPYIEDVARRLALAHFIAFAPDGLTSVGGR